MGLTLIRGLQQPGPGLKFPQPKAPTCRTQSLQGCFRENDFSALPWFQTQNAAIRL